MYTVDDVGKLWLALGWGAGIGVDRKCCMLLTPLQVMEMDTVELKYWSVCFFLSLSSTHPQRQINLPKKESSYDLKHIPYSLLQSYKYVVCSLLKLPLKGKDKYDFRCFYWKWLTGNYFCMNIKRSCRRKGGAFLWKAEASIFQER